MGNTISLIYIATLGTLTARIARVYSDYRYAHKSGLVFDKRAELVERPVSLSCFLLAPDRFSPFAHAAQILKGYTAMGVFRFLYKTLTDYVVGVALETCLLTRYSPKLAVCGARSLALQVASPVGVDAAIAFYGFTCKGDTVAIEGKCYYAQVYAQKIIRAITGFIRRIHYQKQIPLALYEAKVGLTSDMGVAYDTSVVATHKHGYIDAPLQSPDRSELHSVKREDAFIIDDSAMRPESNQGIPIALVSLGNFGNSPDSHLGREPELFTHSVVDDLLDSNLVSHPTAKGLNGNPVARLVETLHRAKQNGVLFPSRREFDFECSKHI